MLARYLVLAWSVSRDVMMSTFDYYKYYNRMYCVQERRLVGQVDMVHSSGGRWRGSEVGDTGGGAAGPTRGPRAL